MGNADSAQQEFFNDIIDNFDCTLREQAHESEYVPFTDECNTDYINILGKYAFDEDCQEESRQKQENPNKIRYTKKCATQMLNFINNDYTFVANCYEVVAKKLKSKNNFILFKDVDHGGLCKSLLLSYQKTAKNSSSNKEKFFSQCLLSTEVFETAFEKNKNLSKMCQAISNQDVYLCNLPSSKILSCNEIIEKSYNPEQLKIECNTNTPPLCKSVQTKL